MVSEMDLMHITRNKEKVNPSHFELLKVLGQGSFGKVCLHSRRKRHTTSYFNTGNGISFFAILLHHFESIIGYNL